MLFFPIIENYVQLVQKEWKMEIPFPFVRGFKHYGKLPLSQMSHEGITKELALQHFLKDFSLLVSL